MDAVIHVEIPILRSISQLLFLLLLFCAAFVRVGGHVPRRTRGQISIVKGNLEAKLPTIWRDENAGHLGRNSAMETVRREKMQGREKVGKSLLWLRRVEKEARESGGCGDICR